MSPPDRAAAAGLRPTATGRGADGSGRVLRARGQKTRARLLDAGATVFARRGFHAARVDDVVEVARSSHGTFYLYFSSKEDLFDQLVDRVATDLDALIDELPIVRDTEEGRAELRDWLARFAALYDRYGSVIRTWTEAELSGAPIGRHGQDVLARLTAAMARNLQTPARATLHPAITALALVTMVERLNYYVATSQVAATPDELLDTLVDVVTAALFG
ncbi:MAG TPA: TetR/AcrR family transcriptional regulator [Acidimicrobiales bacterium]|nr:TetR/AcrR family transcriptional regulator [Acidimicrobiales bacterium]